MNKSDAILFLSNNQPLPPAEELTDDLLKELDNVRKYFLANPSLEALPLLLGVFGNGSGFGVYQLFEDVIQNYPNDLVVDNILKNVKSSHNGVQYWNLEIAANFPDSRLIEPLAEFLSNDDDDLRLAAVIALAQIKNAEVNNISSEHYQLEIEPNIKEIIEDRLKYRI